MRRLSILRRRVRHVSISIRAPRFSATSLIPATARVTGNSMLSKQHIVVGLGELLWDLFPAGKQLGGAPANFAYITSLLGDHAIPASCLGAEATGWNSVLSEQRGDVGEVGRSAAELLSRREQVPKQFAETHDNVLLAQHRVSRDTGSCRNERSGGESGSTNRDRDMAHASPQNRESSHDRSTLIITSR